MGGYEFQHHVPHASRSLQPFEMDERAVFLRFELFAKRLNKLISMFTTVHQFSSLERHTHIAGKWAMWLGWTTRFPRTHSTRRTGNPSTLTLQQPLRKRQHLHAALLHALSCT